MDPLPPTTTSSPLAAGPAAARSLSVNSVSSEGSAESSAHLVEQEDIVVLTHDVRSFKEALGKLRRIFHPERDKTETMRVAAHERLGEVLRILRSILEKYPPIQSTELLMTAGTLIQQVKGYSYEDEKSDPSLFFDAIDQLALAFSSSYSNPVTSSGQRPLFRSSRDTLSAATTKEKKMLQIVKPQHIPRDGLTPKMD
ncbi:hypothetical protein JTE90_008526 [Oedothorax gibbosus]|uniref:Rho GTPase-activating protein 29/45 N-terminal domain-containing protein n=1 Tax=Oedothorax gibbosus TaxID=931172 RepID=A0AAV6VIH8_9ARAC|nr:hypothetical protein JTE90_008526 [Oedothorax gibbosus]